MSRQNNKRQGQQQNGADLLNFRFSTPAPSQQPTYPRGQYQQHGRGGGGRGGGGRGGGGGGGRNNNRNRSQQDRRTKEDRSSARRKASTAMFYLHASPDHAFVLTRRPNRSHQYSFEGPDSPVSWACVRIVKQLSSIEFRESCPICLDTFNCARITKCGHSFCLPCLIHHAQSFAANNPYSTTGPKCPCCSIPLHMEDVRPVLFVSVTTPAVNQTIRLVKLHRVKGCSTPFLPQPEQPKRAAPHAAPGQGDADAAFSRFCYVDPAAYQAQLVADIQELEGMDVYGDIDALCRGMALNAVRKQLQDALAEADEELSYMNRFGQSSSGVCQPQPLHLMAENYVTESTGNVDGIERSRSESMGSESHHEETEADERPRSESVGSDHSGAGSPQRERGESIVSQDSSLGKPRKKVPASMYLGPDESIFYQSEDGRLCFLCGFDMGCLKSDFADSLPGEEVFQSVATASQRRKLSPLPDFVEGRILELEHVHLTPEKRQRLRFLSHLPLYTDICFVELSLGNLISKQTKKIFAKDFQKRKQARMKKVQMEKKEDARIQRQEQARINDLKARIQRIDPDDEFFRPVIPEPEPNFDREDFGPSISGDASPLRQAPVSDAGRLFSQITREGGGAFPSLSSNESAFPALGSSPPTRGPPPPAPWGPVTKSTGNPPSAGPLPGKKKKGGKKIVLFSTGGQRGDLS